MSKARETVRSALWSFLSALAWVGWTLPPPYDVRGTDVQNEWVGPPAGHPERLVPDLPPSPAELDLWAQFRRHHDSPATGEPGKN